MTKLVAAFVLATLATTPAVAQQRHMIFSESARDYAAGDPSLPVVDSYTVIVGDRVIGRDPDPNVRLSLTRDPRVDGD
jgi:hypothetical protein